MRFTSVDEFKLPIKAVQCPFCEETVDVKEWSAVEALWLHEYECRELVPLAA